MAGRKKTILDEVEVIESAVAAELTESNNLNEPTKTAKATETDKVTTTKKTTKTEETSKTKKAPKDEEASKTKKAPKDEEASKTKKAPKDEDTPKTKKTTKTENTTKTEKATKTTKTKTAAKTDKSVKTEKTIKAEKPDKSESVAVIDKVTVIDKVAQIDSVEVVDDLADDIVEYIQPSSLEALKARYGAAEEDEQIRNEGFELVKKNSFVRRPRPEETSFEYYSAPVSKDDIRTDVDSSLSEVFDSTKSEFDADTVSFEDIATVEQTKPQINAPVSQEAIQATGNRYGYDTHTTVIYYDKNTDDGIRRNSEDELTSAFAPESNKQKRRLFPWLRKRK